MEENVLVTMKRGMQKSYGFISQCFPKNFGGLCFIIESLFAFITRSRFYEAKFTDKKPWKHIQEVIQVTWNHVKWCIYYIFGKCDPFGRYASLM